MDHQHQQHGGVYRGGGRGGGRGRGRGGGRGSGGGRGRGRGGAGGRGGRSGGRGGYAPQQQHSFQHSAFEDYGPKSHVLPSNNASGSYQPPPQPPQQQQQTQPTGPGFAPASAYPTSTPYQPMQHQQPVYYHHHQQQQQQPPPPPQQQQQQQPQYQVPPSGYVANGVAYSMQPGVYQSVPQYQPPPLPYPQQQPVAPQLYQSAPAPAPPLPGQPHPSEQPPSSGFVPPLPKHPAPPMSPVLTAYSAVPPSPSMPPQSQSQPAAYAPVQHPPPPQSSYSDALYSRQQAYAPAGTPQHQQQPQPPPPQYHTPSQPQYQVQLVQAQPPSGVGYGQPSSGYQHPPHQSYAPPLQPPLYTAPQPPAPQYQQTQPPPPPPQPPQLSQVPPPPPQPQQQQAYQPPPPQQQTIVPRPPTSTYCCHKCGQPGHWIQECPLMQSNQRGGTEATRQQSSHPPLPSAPQPPLPPSQPAGPQPPPLPPTETLSREPTSTSTVPPLPPAPAPDSEQHTTGSSATNRHEPPLPRYGVPLMDAAASVSAPQQQQQWSCESCDKSFSLESQYHAHVKTHVTCHAPGCSFAASKRVVGAHFQTAHGQYAGDGLKEIDVEGQKFVVLVGNSPEDIANWRAERRKKWPSARKAAAEAQSLADASRKRERSSSTGAAPDGDGDLEDGEVDEGDSVEDTGDGASALSAALPAATERSPKRHKRMCKNFLRQQCRFGDACKFSHSRETIACRSMVQKGKCPKGDACPYGHDAALLASAAAAKELKRQKSRERTDDEKSLEAAWKSEQGSLLRKLLKHDIGVEQQRMLQIVRCIVSAKFFQDDAAPPAAVEGAAPRVCDATSSSDHAMQSSSTSEASAVPTSDG